jgi:hypothetical protein
MIELLAADTFTITGRGTVYLVDRAGLGDLRKLVGTTVCIDGVPMRVRGFESCLIASHDQDAERCTYRHVGLLAERDEERDALHQAP